MHTVHVDLHTTPAVFDRGVCVSAFERELQRRNTQAQPTYNSKDEDMEICRAYKY